MAAVDPVLDAATRALDNRQPAQAVTILAAQHLSHGGSGRLLLARAYVELGEGARALSTLEARRQTSWLQGWPEVQRGEAAQCAGEAEVLENDVPGARWYLGEACLNPGDGMQVDRCLVLLAEMLRHDSANTAMLYARIVWRDWPRSPYHGHAGVMLAEGLAASAPDDARAILAGARLDSQLSVSDRLVAAELLCRLLLDANPGDCLVVAQQEMARIGHAGQQTGQLPLYHALARAALNAHEGLNALLKLPQPLRDEPAAQAAIARLQETEAREGTSHQTLRQIIGQARAEAGLANVRGAQRLLEPLAPTNLAAFAALLELPGVDLGACARFPVTNQPQGAYLLGRAALASGNPQQAWPLLRRALQARDAGLAGDIPLEAVLGAYRSAAQRCELAAADGLKQRLLALDEPGAETGMAWCQQAQDAEQAHADAQGAWEKAARLLPIDHPWKAGAAWRAARPLLAHGQRLADALALLAGPAWSGTSADQLRCRFLLAQVAQCMGDREQALRAATSLIPLADPEQKERLHHLIERLGADPAVPTP